PPSLHLRDPNPAIAWDQLGITVPTETRPLPDRGRPAIAGVSSFGISGANAHVVLAEYVPEASDAAEQAPDTGQLPLPLLLSARTPEALDAVRRSYADHLTGAGRELPLADICHTAARRRDHHPVRLAVTGTTHDELAEQLRELAETAETAVPVRRQRPKVAF